MLDGGVEYDYSNDDNSSIFDDEENILFIVDYLKNNKTKDEFIAFIKDAINPQLSRDSRDFENWKKFLIKNKYINDKEEIIYKPE